jgi:hypothetical protein
MLAKSKNSQERRIHRICTICIFQNGQQGHDKRVSRCVVQISKWNLSDLFYDRQSLDEMASNNSVLVETCSVYQPRNKTNVDTIVYIWFYYY